MFNYKLKNRMKWNEYYDFYFFVTVLNKKKKNVISYRNFHCIVVEMLIFKMLWNGTWLNGRYQFIFEPYRILFIFWRLLCNLMKQVHVSKGFRLSSYVLYFLYLKKKKFNSSECTIESKITILHWQTKIMQCTSDILSDRCGKNASHVFGWL